MATKFSDGDHQMYPDLLSSTATPRTADQAKSEKRSEPEPITDDAEVVPLGQCCRVFCIGRSKLHQMLADGTLPSVKLEKRRPLGLATVWPLERMSLGDDGREPVRVIIPGVFAIGRQL